MSVSGAEKSNPIKGMTGIMPWLGHVPLGSWQGREPSEHVPFFPIVYLAEMEAA